MQLSSTDQFQICLSVNIITNAGMCFSSHYVSNIVFPDRHQGWKQNCKNEEQSHTNSAHVLRLNWLYVNMHCHDGNKHVLTWVLFTSYSEIVSEWSSGDYTSMQSKLLLQKDHLKTKKLYAGCKPVVNSKTIIFWDRIFLYSRDQGSTNTFNY